MDSIVKKLLESHNSNRLHEVDTDDKAYQEYLSNMRSNVTYKKLDALCSEYGYELKNAVVYDGVIEIGIHADNGYPRIYYDYRKYGEVVNQFHIQTISVGALTLEEYEEFLEKCNNAYKLVKSIKKLDLNTLYRFDREDWED